MQLKDYFTVPSGQKITEKHLRRVLISSICGMLLCMSCLAGTTWAWFTVSIENTNNVIQIGEPQILLSVGGSNWKSGDSLAANGEYVVLIEHANDWDYFEKKSTLYVTLTIKSESGIITRYTVLDSKNQYRTEVTIQSELDFELTWEVSWFAPPNAIALEDDPIVIVAPAVPETTEAPTDESKNESSVPTENPSGDTQTPSDTPSGEPVTPPETTTGQTEEPSETTSEPTGDAEGSDEPQNSEPSAEIPDDSATADSTESDSQTSTDDSTDEEA